MRFLPLVWKNLWRRKVRTAFTFLSILVAFALFGFLVAIRVAFNMGVDVAGNDRLVLIHKVSFIQLLPESYWQRIRAVAGVVDTTHATWFGGIYQDQSNFFAQMAVDGESWLRLYPEYALPDDQKKAWLADRTGAMIGRSLADRFGWKVGDRVPIQGTIWRQRNTNTWEFTIDGIYDGTKKGTDNGQLFFHYKFLDEARPFARGQVGWYVIRIDDPANAADIARRIDAQFANSAAETKTSPEKAFAQAFANQVGDIGAIVTSIVAAVFFTILIVVANTISQSVRERTSELAVLKTLGYSNWLILTLVLMESCALTFVAGALGLVLSWAVLENVQFSSAFLPAFYVPRDALVAGGLFVVLLGLLAGTMPAVQAMRLRIVDALRRV
ncbi:MAG: ABC transporter permease [Acidobacteria bacterium]|nr:ABC transporter permease [Acidobacteriota bacterium]